MLRRRINVSVNAVEVGDHIEVGTPKTHQQRSVPVPSSLAVPITQLCETKDAEDFVFGGRYGEHIRRTRTDGLSRGWFSQAIRRADLPTLTPTTYGTQPRASRSSPAQT